jgi:hypothetical protein
MDYLKINTRVTCRVMVCLLTHSNVVCPEYETETLTSVSDFRPLGYTKNYSYVLWITPLKPRYCCTIGIRRNQNRVVLLTFYRASLPPCYHSLWILKLLRKLVELPGRAIGPSQDVYETMPIIYHITRRHIPKRNIHIHFRGIPGFRNHSVRWNVS